MESCHIVKRPRPLTFDEQRAAEAAFAGEPVCADWSEAGRKVYEGLVTVLLNRADEGRSLSAMSEVCCSE